MKVKFKYGIKTYSGTVDGMTYGSYRKGNLCIGREYVYPTLTDNNHQKGAIVKNLAKVYSEVSSDYLADLKTYGVRNGKENVPRNQLIPTSFSLWLKMMFAWGASDPTHIDLATVTLADIVALDAEVYTIAQAVEAGFLPMVTMYEDLTSSIQ
ncbi:MAG TPA: hypothetical protein PLF50_02200 [Candidatus Cloacimonadota bacterium]|nr:hypothetical protein [Candidatus Cloacimonadota bacterium]